VKASLAGVDGYIGGLLAPLLMDETMICYKMQEFYDPQLERGVRWNDPAFSIAWPDAHPTINARDASHPDFQC
jgi:dTDP-4-dehydrorhamnose 3,5-epimerase